MMSNRFLDTFGRHAFRERGEPRAGLIGILLDWTSRARQRRALAELDDRLLRDIGLPPNAARAEATKWIWRA